MTTIVTRAGKGSPLTNAELDANFSNLNGFKVEQTAATGAAQLPSGSTAQRPGTPAAGYIRYNATTGKFEGYGSAWGNIGGGAFIGDTAPANPGAGDLWWNSATGHTFVYYGSAWVDLFGGAEGQYLPLTGGTLSGNLTLTGSFNGLTVGKGPGSISTNTVFGYLAAQNISTGGDNTFIGNQAGTSVTTGADNTGIGIGALGLSSAFGLGYNTGTANTAVGASAHRKNTTGSYNVAVGSGVPGSYAAALQENTTGSYNTALGNGALGSNTTANGNTVVGYQAGYTQSGGTGYNQLFGYQAGYSLTTGSYNALIGRAAGADITTGAKNTILGSFTGNGSGLDIRTASNYIVLSDGDGIPRVYNDGTSTHFNSNIKLYGSGGHPVFLWYPYNRVSGPNTNYAQTYYNGDNNNFYVINTLNGVYLALNGTSWASASDARNKTDLVPITNALDKVAKLRTVTGRYKTDEEGVSRSFFIAQDFQGNFEEALEDSDPEKLGVQYSDTTPLLAAAINELSAKLEALEARIH